MSKLKSVEQYGKLYRERFLGGQIKNRDDIYHNWWKALEFAFTKTFYRGRRDELSEKFMRATLNTLRSYDLDENYNRQLLDKQLSVNGVNNSRDRRMVLELLDFTFGPLRVYNNNLVRWTVEKIRAGLINEVSDELQRIYAIGDKISSFYLRDVVLIYKLEGHLKPNDFTFCQPIDTWVRQVAIKLKLILSAKLKDEDVKSAIVKKCVTVGVSPLLFNAGAWLVGAKSFELLIESL